MSDEERKSRDSGFRLRESGKENSRPTTRRSQPLRGSDRQPVEEKERDRDQGPGVKRKNCKGQMRFYDGV